MKASASFRTVITTHRSIRCVGHYVMSSLDLSVSVSAIPARAERNFRKRGPNQRGSHPSLSCTRRANLLTADLAAPNGYCRRGPDWVLLQQLVAFAPATAPTEYSGFH